MRGQDPSSPLPHQLISSSHRRLITSSPQTGLRTISLWTLVSRVLGLVRDMGMAALFGNGVVMDAFSVAFRIPNLFRRMFGEGALTSAFLPAFVHELHETKTGSPWKLASVLLVLLGLTLGGLVLLGEGILWGVLSFGSAGPEVRLLLGLTAILLPYVILVCLAAQVSAILHALDHFTWPALLPVLLNVIWIVALWSVAPRFASAPEQIRAVAVCIVLAGVVQLAAPLPVLHRLGFRFDPDWRAVRSKVYDLLVGMIPIVLGLSITQLNTLADSLTAWTFAQPETGPHLMRLPGRPEYPLQSGTASALYFGQRVYQFPLGVFGVALGTALFPRLSRHVESGRWDRLRGDVSLGLRLVLLIGLPASLGLMLLAEPLTALLFRHGAFDAADVQQTVAMIVAYAVAVWAYCGVPLVHRAYYAAGDRGTPLRIGVVTTSLNVVLNFILIWFLGGPGLALATAVSAILQIAAGAWWLQGRIGRWDWRPLGRALIRGTVATLVMAVVCGTTLWLLPAGDALPTRLLRVAVPLVVSIAVYLGLAALLGLNELQWLWRRGEGNRD